MKNHKSYGKPYFYLNLGVIVIAIFYNINLLFQNMSGLCDLNELFCQTIFDTYKIMENKMYLLAFDSIYIIILFHIFFGRYLEKEISQHGAYIFSRVDSRKKWFLKKSLSLMKFSSAYTFLYLFTTLIICMISTHQIIDSGSLSAFFFLWFALNTITFLSTLFINYIAIFHTEQLAFISIYIIMVLLIFFNINLKNISWINSESLLHYINPMALMSLYTADSSAIKAIIICFYMIVCILSVLSMSNKITKLDISINLKR